MPEFPTEQLNSLIDSGLLAASLPIHLGGSGLGVDPGVRGGVLPLLKEVGRRDLPLGRIFEGHVNALLLLHTFGTPQQLAVAAEEVLERDHVFGVWNTGPPGSPQLTQLACGCYKLSGRKTFATGAARIQKAIVTAALPDGGWQMCLVPLTVPLTNGTLQIRPGSWDPLGMEASESFTVDFCDMRLPADALIGHPGDYYVEPTFTGGAFRFCAVHLGGAQALYDACCEFVRITDRAGDLFAIQRLGQMAVLLESGRQWLKQSGECLESNCSDVAVQAQMMRIATEEICTRVIQLVQLTVGARGLATAEPFSRNLRDLQMYLRQAGYDQAFQLVGRHALRNEKNPV
jgi:alkylation response protein AidB-like acyl-CoA dehydrogenase